MFLVMNCWRRTEISARWFSVSLALCSSCSISNTPIRRPRIYWARVGDIRFLLFYKHCIMSLFGGERVFISVGGAYKVMNELYDCVVGVDV